MEWVGCDSNIIADELSRLDFENTVNFRSIQDSAWYTLTKSRLAVKGT